MNEMETRIDVVDGADGYTPDMLRHRDDTDAATEAILNEREES